MRLQNPKAIDALIVFGLGSQVVGHFQTFPAEQIDHHDAETKGWTLVVSFGSLHLNENNDVPLLLATFPISHFVIKYEVQSASDSFHLSSFRLGR
jgi:hypothetical protein